MTHPRPAARPVGDRLLTGVTLGALFGAAVLYFFGEETRFAVYGLVALVAMTFLPKLVQRVGSVERLLFLAVLVSYQLDVAVAISYRPFKPAGPYGFLITPILLAAAMLLALRLLYSSRYLGPRLARDRSLSRAFGLMLAAGVLSSVNTVDRQLVSFGVFELLTVGLIMWVVMDQCRTREGLRDVQRVLTWTLVIQGLLIIGSFATGVQISLSHGVRGADYGWAESGRFAGTLNVPSAAATTLVVCLLSALTRLYQEATPLRRWWLYGELGLGSFALLLTQTRTAWIGFVLGAAGVLWAAVRRGDLSGRRLAQLAGVCLVALLAAWPFIAGRVGEDHSDDAEVRWQLIDIAVEMIKAHPVVGIGLNTATSQLREYAARAGAKGWVFIVHNQFLLVWAETGLLGFLGFCWLFRLGFQGARRLIRSSDPELRNAGLWLFWSFVMLVWALNMDHLSGGASYKLVFLLFGVACGAAGLAAATEAAPAEAPAAGGPRPVGSRAAA